jgi:hypothetical protein
LHHVVWIRRFDSQPICKMRAHVEKRGNRALSCSSHGLIHLFPSHMIHDALGLLFESCVMAESRAPLRSHHESMMIPSKLYSPPPPPLDVACKPYDPS